MTRVTERDNVVDMAMTDGGTEHASVDEMWDRVTQCVSPRTLMDVRDFLARGVLDVIVDSDQNVNEAVDGVER